MRRFVNKRTLRITAISIGSLAVVLGLAFFLFVRLGYFSQWITNQVKIALSEYNIRMEVGSLSPSFRDFSVELKQVKLYAGDDKEPFGLFDQLNAKFKIYDLFKIGSPTQVHLDDLKIDGLKFWYKLDEKGISNLSKLKFAQKNKEEKDRVEFDYSAAKVELHRAEIFYVDTMRQLDGNARNLEVKISPDRDKLFRIIAAADNCNFTLDGRETSDIGFKLNSLANESSAIVESLTTTSPLMHAEMKGEVKNWEKLDYALDAKADIKMAEITRVFVPGTRLNGIAHFDGKVVGQGIEYQANGKLSSENLVARDVHIEGLNLKFNGDGKGAEFKASEELLFQKLDAAGFKVNRAVAAGRIAGNGQDFNWLMNFNAAEILSPDVKATNLRFSDAKLNFRADNFEQFKVTGKAKIEHLVTADVEIGNISGDVTATRNEVSVPNFNGAVFGGQASGSARVRIDGKGSSEVKADLAGLNLDKATAVTAGKRLPVRGIADGKVNLAWQGFDYKSAEGTANLKFKGATLTQDEVTGAGTVDGLPITGEFNAVASQRRIKINDTVIQTGSTNITVSGDIGWDKTGALDVRLNSADAAELQKLGLDLAKGYDAEAVKEFSDQEIQLTNKLSFNGRVIGSLEKPQVSGRFALDAVNWHDEPLGALTGEVLYAGDSIRVENGNLKQPDGGQADFDVTVPFNVDNGIAVKTNLKGLSLASALRAALSLPVQIEGFATGNAEITGLPEAMHGNAQVKIANAKYGNKAFDEFDAKLTLDSSRVELTGMKLRSGTSALTGNINFDTKSKGYIAKLQGENIDLNEWVNVAREENQPPIPLSGRVNVNLEADCAELSLLADPEGKMKKGRIFDHLNATVISQEIDYKNEPIKTPSLSVTGQDSLAKISLKGEALGQTHNGAGQIDFSDPNAPMTFALNFSDLELARVLALVSESELQAGGKAAGQIRIAGNLFGKNDQMRIESEFSNLYFDITDYRLSANTPFVVKVNTDQVDLGTIKLSGNNTNVEVKGTVALGENGKNSLAVNGGVNLKVLQTFVKDIFADGVVKIEAAATGNFKQPKFSGTASLQDGALRIPGFPLGLNHTKARVLFTADQAQLAAFEADVGVGKIRASGGASFAGFKPNRWRFQIKPEGVRVDYPRDARATLDGDLELQGSREIQLLSGIVNVRRTEYLADVDLFEFIERLTEEFGNPTIGADSGEPSAIPPTQLDIRVVANETLDLRTKLIDVVGSLALRLRGPIQDPTVGGRITITRGIVDNIFNQRFRITNAGTIEFPGVDKRSGQINIEAESDIKGYRVIANFTGPLNQPRFRLRAEPSLPESEVYNLVATGRLQNEDRLSSSSSSQALAQTSLNTAASFIANRASRSVESNVTGRLFGLNRFSVDPLLTGRGTDPTARITIGRRVTKDLSITYSTNLASNQDQVILIEYQASDRLSFVASRAQDGTFGLDVRLRKRF